MTAEITDRNVSVDCKVKCSRYRPGLVQRVGRGLALLFHDRGTRRWWVVTNTLRPHFTPRKDSVPILQEAGWAPGAVWTGSKNLVPTGIWSRTVQPVVSRYTDWSTQPTSIDCIFTNLRLPWSVGPCHHGMTRLQVADRGTASNMEGSCEYIE